MENHKVQIDPIEEALRLVYLNADNTFDVSLELNRIIASEYPIEVSLNKKNNMVNSLYEKLAVDSLGILISQAIERKQLSIKELSFESNLPLSTLELLQADLILANSIPIMSFQKLLKRLQIPLEKAQEAIIKTFHILKNELAFSTTSVNSIHLAYRRSIKVATSINSKASKSEIQHLFQNEEALTKYLNRLSELYNY